MLGTAKFSRCRDANSAVKILSLWALEHALNKYQDGRCGEARAISRRVAMKDCSHLPFS